eukprot:5704337-Pyramimonas_sp.AAC.1
MGGWGEANTQKTWESMGKDFMCVFVCVSRGPFKLGGCSGGGCHPVGERRESQGEREKEGERE